MQLRFDQLDTYVTRRRLPIVISKKIQVRIVHQGNVTRQEKLAYLAWQLQRGFVNATLQKQQTAFSTAWLFILSLTSVS